MSKPAPIETLFSEWNTDRNKYLEPKINKSGGKSITLLNPAVNRSLHITTPCMMTWGIADFVDEKTGESDGKYQISLNFPQAEYANADTDLFLKKMSEFQNQIVEDAVKNSPSWFGKKMSREILEHTFFPFIKYQKDKTTKNLDMSKPPSIRAKVPVYDGKWAVEIYDTRSKLIFPSENPDLTPIDFVPKLSQVACLLQCGGIWLGGKGWGVTWKLVQAVVKPRETVSVSGKCRIPLSLKDTEVLDAQVIEEEEEVVVKQSVTAAHKLSVVVDDSDDEEESKQSHPMTTRAKVEAVPEPVEAESPEPESEPEKPVEQSVEAESPEKPETIDEAVEEKKPTVKKVVKKIVAKK